LYNNESLTPLSIQYKDYAAWQNDALENGLLQQETFWLNQFLGNLPILNFPTDFPRPDRQQFEGNSLNFTLSKELMTKARALTKTTSTSMYMLLLATYTTLLSKYDGQEDIIVGSPTAGRSHDDLKNSIGIFVNTIALRNYPTAKKPFTTFLNEVKTNTLAALENQDYQFEELLDKLNLKRDLSRNPLFDVMFSFKHDEPTEKTIQGLTFAPIEQENNISKFDLTFGVIDYEDEIAFNIEYATKLFSETTMQQFFEHFITLLSEILADPNQQIKNLNILDDKAANSLLGLNNSPIQYPSNSIVELFEERVKQNPNKTALIYNDQEISYQTLNEKSNQLAHTLKEKGIGSGKVVALLFGENYL